MQRPVADADRQGHAQTVSQILLKAGRAGKALGTLDDLRETFVAAIDAGPKLAAGRFVLGDRNRRWHVDGAAQGQGRAGQSGGLGEPPADEAHPHRDDAAAIGDRPAAGQPF